MRRAPLGGLLIQYRRGKGTVGDGAVSLKVMEERMLRRLTAASGKEKERERTREGGRRVEYEWHTA